MIHTHTRREAWLAGVEYLFTKDTELNLVLVVEAPGADEPAASAVTKLVDSFLRDEDQQPLHTVAETIFPGWEYQRRGLRGVFETYAKEEYPAFKKADQGRWGSYAHRLVHRIGADGTSMNPLKNLIDKLKKEKNQPGPKTSCYEVSVAEGAYDLPLYNTVDDDRRHMGGPCLSHVSFKLYDSAIHLSAFYRSHDYRYKVLGNLLGLARLQACVAHEVGLPLGTLAVHSSYAWIDLKKGKRRLEKLLADIRNIEQEEVGNGLVV